MPQAAAHPVPGPPPAPRRSPDPGPSAASPLLAVGWVLFVLGVSGVVAGLMTGRLPVLGAAIAMIAVAGITASIDLTDRTGATRRQLRALLLSGLSRRGPL